MNKLLDEPILNQEDTNHLNRAITNNEIEAATKFPKERKAQGLMDSLQFYQT
jgi:hypothetical protein